MEIFVRHPKIASSRGNRISGTHAKFGNQRRGIFVSGSQKIKNNRNLNAGSINAGTLLPFEKEISALNSARAEIVTLVDDTCQLKISSNSNFQPREKGDANNNRYPRGPPRSTLAKTNLAPKGVITTRGSRDDTPHTNHLRIWSWLSRTAPLQKEERRQKI